MRYSGIIIKGKSVVGKDIKTADDMFDVIYHFVRDAIGNEVILAGKQDTEVGYKDQFKLLEKYPKATYCALHRAGHNLRIEQPKFLENIFNAG